MVMTRRSMWYSIRGSLWFVPAGLLLLGVALALSLVQFDQWLDARDIQGLPEALFAGPEGARQILSVIAGSIITVAGVIFSVTIVTLSLAAAQYSPRVLRTFMRDRLNQAVLGVLVMVFAYNLLVLRAVRTGGHYEFVPQISLWFGILLVFIAIGFFIAFIHNTAMSIQAPEIVSRIAHETLQAMDAVRQSSKGDRSANFSEQLPDSTSTSKLHWQTISAQQSGYIQDVDIERLYEIACHHDVILRVERPVGDFAVQGRPLISISGRDKLEQALIQKVQQQFGINSYRTVDQDPAFGVRQLVDIALKALAPSSNDSTTAVHCIDHLSVILHRAMQYAPLPQTHCEAGKLRLITPHHSTAHLVDLALNEIRQNALGNVAILLRLFRLTRQLREDVRDPLLRKRIREHVELISESIDRNVPSPADRKLLHDSARRAIAAGATEEQKDREE